MIEIVLWLSGYLVLSGYGARYVWRKWHPRETVSEIEKSEEWVCKCHYSNSVPVILSTGETVAWVCPRCLGKVVLNSMDTMTLDPPARYPRTWEGEVWHRGEVKTPERFYGIP